MDFFESLNAQSLKADFGTKKAVMSSKSSVFALNRPHTSLSMVKENATEVSLNQAFFFPGKEGLRYIISREITFDLLLTIYEVNSHMGVFARISKPLEKEEIAKIKNMLLKIGKSNFEMRAIGLQNADSSLVKSVRELHDATKAELIEVDLFGNMKRHFALDTKTGMSYDLLLEDKAYRAEELINTQTPDEFKASASKLNFM